MSIPLQLVGREAGTARLPELFAPASRSVDPAQCDFLPEGYLSPGKTFEVDPATRRAVEGEGQTPLRHQATDDEVLVLELADGELLVTSAARLRESMQRAHPEWVAEDGTLALEALRADAAASRGGLGEAVGGLIRRVFSFTAGSQPDDILLEAAREAGIDRALLGVSHLGTRALMWAIERRLPNGRGLYAWHGGARLDAEALTAFEARVAAAPAQHPVLIFLHGTASHTLGSFGALQAAGPAWWAALAQRYPGGVYGFEHPTLSQSPIDNALALLALLPDGAHVSLVSHSRGGLVGDLLCLGPCGERVAAYCHTLEGTGDADPAEAERVIGELKDVHAGQRQQLHLLMEQLQRKAIVVQRYVRVACPAAGTRLAGGNIDLFLSGLLTLVGRVPLLFGSPWYAAFKRVVIEIARNRTNPRLVPGIEAMLPDAPMAALLRDAPVREGLQMAVIAGDIQGAGLLQRVAVLLTDHLLFDRVDHDLVVDTRAMLAGVATRAAARLRMDRGADVSHFRYFENADTRDALGDWLLADDPQAVTDFRALPTPAEFEAALEEAATQRDASASDRPVVVVLPGVMGSHLVVGAATSQARDRVWLDPLDIAAGGLRKIAWGRPDIDADELFGMSYGKLCKQLSASHRVERFPYDWRQPLDVLADRLAVFLRSQLDRGSQPVRLLAHSMGGLVVRACIHRHRALMDELMARNGSRLIQCGTPNQGAYSMVENLIGKGDTLRMLVRLDLKNDMQQVLDIVAGFRGALQLLPKPGLRDEFQGQADGGAEGWAFQRAETWSALAPKVRDFWFGNGRVGRPDQSVLDAAAWLWSQDGMERPALPAAYADKSIYVAGVAASTPCGLREVGGRLKMVATTRGDGTVTWASGRIGGLGSWYYLPAEHGDLLAAEEHFPALAELLTQGRTERLDTHPPAVRAIEADAPRTYDAGPPDIADAEALQRLVVGGSLRRRTGGASPPRRRLAVQVQARDLRFLDQPILVGHYEQDPIAGPQALIDRELLQGALNERYRLDFYPGPLGSAIAVVHRPNDAEQQRGSLAGAVVTGLGRYDRPLTPDQLTTAVRTGALRYLMQAADVLGRAPRELPLAALLIGYNSSANLTVAASVEALVRGVLEANARFRETTHLDLRIHQLDLVELYLDTAITAAYALRDLPARLAAEAEQHGQQLVCAQELARDPSCRPRLYDSAGQQYWPRLMVTDARVGEGDDGSTRPAGSPASSDCAVAGTPAAQGRSTPGAAGRAGLPDRLRFLYIGQRARAESVMHQRQPGLVESLVRSQIHTPVWNEDFGRMLFQLMVPHDFKEAARQLERVVLVVDAGTANLPWELMLADDPDRPGSERLPLALRTPVVRQLTSAQYRRQVRPGAGLSALVVGNPSVEGFVQSFPGTAERPGRVPPNLPKAEEEAREICAVLRGSGHEVLPVIGDDRSATDVLAALYRRPWRLLHISAHGVFDLCHADGRGRSGVLLSDGLLITAAEIQAMEVVPELVFLNCCHLGKVEGRGWRDGNKLAASVARELIEIGVRCVIVAGWAVDDAGARVFGETFYKALLISGRSFGDAVFEARKAVWRVNRSDITWGAFQAYGDPGWQALPRGEAREAAGKPAPYVSPDELLDALARQRVDLSQQQGRHGQRERRTGVAALEARLRERCPPAWLDRPDILAALGATWRDLGEFRKAVDAYRGALLAKGLGAAGSGGAGDIHLTDLEQLANVEARLGEATNDPVLVQEAIARLESLDRLMPAGPHQGGAKRFTERHAVIGSAWKRLAGVHARRLLDDQRPSGEGDGQRLASEQAALRDALERSASAYLGSPAASGSEPYLLLNRLALLAVLGERLPAKAIDLARRAGELALQQHAADPTSWNAVMPAEALLVEHLLDGSLGQPGEAGEQVREALIAGYREATQRVLFKPPEIDSVLTQMELLSRFLDALSLGDAGDIGAARQRSADRLLALVQALQAGRPKRKDRPAPRAPAEPPPRPAGRRTRQA